MGIYANTLKRLNETVGEDNVVRNGDGKLVHRLKANVVYAVRCQDNTDYYRTVLIKSVQLSGGYQTFITNPVYGSIPPGMSEVDQSQVFKQMRDMNSSLSVTTLDAFPYQGKA
jgi:hypothetical protein